MVCASKSGGGFTDLRHHWHFVNCVSLLSATTDPVVRWRPCVETLSSRRFVTSPSTSSCSVLFIGCCTTSSSWRGSANTTHPLTTTSGTLEVPPLTVELLRYSTSVGVQWRRWPLCLFHLCSGFGRHLWDGAPAPRHYDEDGELPETSGAEQGPDGHRQPRYTRQGMIININIFKIHL